jgi:hypothetical protein
MTYFSKYFIFKQAVEKVSKVFLLVVDKDSKYDPYEIFKNLEYFQKLNQADLDEMVDEISQTILSEKIRVDIFKEQLEQTFGRLKQDLQLINPRLEDYLEDMKNNSRDLWESIDENGIRVKRSEDVISILSDGSSSVKKEFDRFKRKSTEYFEILMSHVGSLELSIDTNTNDYNKANNPQKLIVLDKLGIIKLLMDASGENNYSRVANMIAYLIGGKPNTLEQNLRDMDKKEDNSPYRNKINEAEADIIVMKLKPKDPSLANKSMKKKK